MATRIRLPPLNAVRAFEVTARHLNYRTAADELCVTPGAVGQHVRSLEGHLGVKLFVRLSGALALTVVGRAYADSIRASLLQLARATEEVTGKRIITVWAPPSLATRWLGPRLNILRAAHENAELRICADIAEADITQADIDLVIEHRPGPRGASSLKLFDEALYPVCSPELFEGLGHPADPAILLTQTLLHTSLYDFWEAWMGSAGIASSQPPRGPFFNQATVALEAAAAGQGFALAVDQLVERDLKDGRLIKPFGHRLNTSWAYYVAAPQGALSMDELESLRRMLLAPLAETVSLPRP